MKSDMILRYVIKMQGRGFARAGAEQNQVYWGRLWPAGLALAHYILQHPHTVRGREVCELGAGLGLAGLAAAVAGKLATSECSPLATGRCIGGG